MKLEKFSGNPILRPNPRNSWENLVVCNPGVWYEDGVFYMLYRAAGDDPTHPIFLGLAISTDGFHFERASDEPVLSPRDDGPDGGCIEDPRIVKFGDTYYVTYAYRPFRPGQYWKHRSEQVFSPGTSPEERRAIPEASRLIKENLTNTGLLMSKDLRTFYRLGRLTEPNVDNRDVILFPEKVRGKYVLLHRPMDIPWGLEHPAMWISFMDSLLDFNPGEVLAKNEYWWETKIGGSCPPLKTDAGWLTIYHGVCPDKVYRAGAMLLDLEDPSKILCRTPEPILEPEHDYEQKGVCAHCVFPCGNVIVDGKLFVYYGTADKYVAVATCQADELVEYLLCNPFRVVSV